MRVRAIPRGLDDDRRVQRVRSSDDVERHVIGHASLGGHADFGKPVPQLAHRRNDLRAAFAISLLRGAHSVDHEVLRFRHALDRSQADGQVLENVLLTQVEQSVLSARDRQRSLQERNRFLVMPGFSARLRQHQQRRERALAIVSAVQFRERCFDLDARNGLSAPDRAGAEREPDRNRRCSGSNRGSIGTTVHGNGALSWTLLYRTILRRRQPHNPGVAIEPMSDARRLFELPDFLTAKLG
jgi:hypothetical protein